VSEHAEAHRKLCLRGDGLWIVECGSGAGMGRVAADRRDGPPRAGAVVYLTRNSVKWKKNEADDV